MSQVENGAATDGVARSRYHVEALARGLSILSLFTPDEPCLGLSEIARRADLSTATALRFVSTLRSLGYLEQCSPGRKYRPSVASLRLGYTALSGLEVRDLALPVLQRLFEQLNETVNLSILAGTEIVYIERLKTKELITAGIQVGTRLPAYCTSMGKAMMAFLPPDELERLLPQLELTLRGPNAITSVERLRAHLQWIREHGYSPQDEELVAGMRSVAAPVLDRAGRPVAAMNAAVPAARISARELHEHLAPTVVRAAGEVTALLRYRYETPAGPAPRPASSTGRPVGRPPGSPATQAVAAK